MVQNPGSNTEVTGSWDFTWMGDIILGYKGNFGDMLQVTAGT